MRSGRDRQISQMTLTDGSVRRVWYVGGQTNCTHVNIWRPNEGLEMFFSAKGCVEVTRHFNGKTPDAPDEDSQTIHVCDVRDFAMQLLEGLDLAADYWHKI